MQMDADVSAGRCCLNRIEQQVGNYLDDLTFEPNDCPLSLNAPIY